MTLRFIKVCSFLTFFAQLLVFLLARLYASLIFSRCEVYLKITGVSKCGWQTQSTDIFYKLLSYL